ncbi:hypothetical protein CCFV1_ORF092 [Cotesia congregata filamentous virus 1]|uniref:Uncharacterized protein n=1 Tax=Cotesia congregata filamentous virus 1 TaxID=3064291 RepID=A0ABC8QND3_9VIRU|nr:hypothetical protein CCFV1_ORF092 [Cotesia congregata filamentous virus 1]
MLIFLIKHKYFKTAFTSALFILNDSDKQSRVEWALYRLSKASSVRFTHSMTLTSR